MVVSRTKYKKKWQVVACNQADSQLSDVENAEAVRPSSPPRSEQLEQLDKSNVDVRHHHWSG